MSASMYVKIQKTGLSLLEGMVLSVFLECLNLALYSLLVAKITTIVQK